MPVTQDVNYFFFFLTINFIAEVHFKIRMESRREKGMVNAEENKRGKEEEPTPLNYFLTYFLGK